MKNPFKKKENNESAENLEDVTRTYRGDEKLNQNRLEEAEDDEYEYITPHYTGNAVLALVLAILVSSVASFILFNKVLRDKTVSSYLNKGYILTNDATATADFITEGKVAYVRGQRVVGTYKMMDGTLADATPNDILEGYTAYSREGKITGTIKTYNGLDVVTPGTSNIVIRAGQYVRNGISISGSTNLQSSNIRKGITLFGVRGNYGNE